MINRYVSAGLLTAMLISGATLDSAGAEQESKQVAQGRAHYAETCVLCHGADGKRGDGFQTPIWGQGAMIASKFGNAQAMIDYMQLMPFNDPALLDENQKLAVVAFLLANHGSIKRMDEVTVEKAKDIPIK
ncbi:MAG: c-type cytochrome [Beijerinckiaceae bacterium]